MNTRCYVVYFAGLNGRSYLANRERSNTRCFVVMSRGRIHVVLLLYCLSKQHKNKTACVRPLAVS